MLCIEADNKAPCTQITRALSVSIGFSHVRTEIVSGRTFMSCEKEGKCDWQDECRDSFSFAVFCSDAAHVKFSRDRELHVFSLTFCALLNSRTAFVYVS